MLHYVADLSVEQIAQETGIAAGTLKSHLARGRTALAPLLSELSDETPARTAKRGRDHEDGSERKDYDYA